MFISYRLYTLEYIGALAKGLGCVFTPCGIPILLSGAARRDSSRGEDVSGTVHSLSRQRSRTLAAAGCLPWRPPSALLLGVQRVPARRGEAGVRWAGLEVLNARTSSRGTDVVFVVWRLLR